MKLFFLLALHLIQSKGQDVDCEHVLFSDAGPVTAVASNEITRIGIRDKMVYEMDVAVKGIPSGWASVFHCGESNEVRQPGIWLHDQSDDAGATHQGFHYSFSTTAVANPWINPGPAVAVGGTYHLVMTYTQDSLTIVANGDTVYENGGYAVHPDRANQPCYVGDPWYPAAPVEVSNIKISSFEECVCRSPLYEQDGDIVQAQNNQITTINIEDDMVFSMDVTINSIPGEWASVFHCGVDNGHRTPGIWLYPDSDDAGATHEGFHFVFSHDADNPWLNPGPHVTVGETYHIEQIITQTTHSILVDGVRQYDDNQYGSHVNPQNIPCYAGDPWYPAADVDITNLKIESGTIDCNCPHMFEYSAERNKCVRDCSLFAFEDYRDTCSSYEADLGGIRSSITAAVNGFTPRIDALEQDLNAVNPVLNEQNARIGSLEATVIGLGEAAAYPQFVNYDYSKDATSFFQQNKDLLLVASLLMNGVILVSMLMLCVKFNKNEMEYAKVSTVYDSEQAQLRI